MARINRNYFIIGCLLSMASGAFWPIMPSLIWLLPIVVLFVVLFSTKNAFWLQGICLGSLIIIIHGNHYRHVTEKLFSHGNVITVQAQIVEFSQSTLHGGQTILSIRSIGGEDLPAYARPQVKAYYTLPTQSQYKLGEVWQFQLEVKPVIGRLNDAGFDSERYYVSNQWHGKAVIDAKSLINIRLKSTNSGRFLLREKILPMLDDLPNRAFILALAFGDRSGITDSQWQQLRDSGLSHLMAISGLHIALAMAIGWHLGRAVKSLGLQFMSQPSLLGRLLPLRVLPLRFFPLISSFTMAFSYAYLAGFALPTQRALIMGSLFMLMLRFRLYWSPWQVLLFTLVLVLALQPFSILQASFWLSFSAIVIIYITLWFYWQSENCWRVKLIHIIVLQFGLFIGLAFLTVNYFGGVSWVSPFVNLIAIPWVSMFVVPAIFFALLMTLFMPNILFVTNTFAAPIWRGIDVGLAPVSYLLKLTQGAWLSVSANVGTLCFFLVILLILLRFRCYLTALVSGLIVTILMTFPVNIRPSWQIQVLDVGQGLAILLRKDRHSVLYDTGINWQGGSMANSIIAPLLNQDGEEQLSGLIISHTDSDHAGGRQDVEQQLKPIWRRSSEKLPNYSPCIKGESWHWQGLHFEALWPPKQVTRAYNPHSCVIRISDNTFSMLFTGDIDAISEILLTRSAGIKPVDVMTVPHHGSATSSFPNLLQAFKPKVAIASVALNNQWGLPSQEVKQRYQQAGIEWLDTGSGGQITLSIYPNSWSIKQKRRNQYQPWYRQIVRNGLE